MKNLFDPENRLMQAITRLTDLLILSILWTVCSIPLVTIGPATAALYYVTLKMTDDSESSIMASFFRSFRQNFRQGIILTVISALIALLLYWDRGLLMNLLPSWQGVVQILFRVLGGIYVMGQSILFPLLSRYENSVLRTLRNAYLLAFACLPRAMAAGLLNLIPLAVFLFAPNAFYRSLPVWFIFAPGLIAYLCAWLLKKPLGGREQRPAEP